MRDSGEASTVKIYPLQPSSDAKALRLRCPSDKSLTHRAVIFASLAKGRSEIRTPLMSADCRATMAAFVALGVSIEQRSDLIEVESGGWDQWKSPQEPLDFANSGTTARLLTGLFAATPGLAVACFGDASLSKRPMGRVVKPLRKMGADIQGKEDGAFLPIKINGRKLQACDHVVDKASAQVKSALCLAALNCEGTSRVRLPAGSRTHTELLLARLGAQIEHRRIGGEETIEVKGPFRPSAFKLRVPSDPSSVAFFAVLVALHPHLKMTLLDVLQNNTRCGFVAKLAAAGVALEVQAVKEGAGDFMEPVSQLECSGGALLKAFTIDPVEVPTLIDEVPILAVLAAFAEGRSHFRGLGELRVKESDRLQQTVVLLRAAGIDVEARADELFVSGGQRSVRAFEFDPQDDHRLAMAAAVLATRAQGTCVIKGPECVDVSFPGFFKTLTQCNVRVEGLSA